MMFYTEIHYDYEGLIEQFISKEIDVYEFERVYLEKFLEEKVPIGGEKFDLLDWLFAEIDAFTDDEEAVRNQPKEYINEEQLRKSATEVLEKLKNLV